jgi:citrate synthase
VAVADTRIAKSGADGSLTYRGYDVKDLFEHASFEETAYLVLEGGLPNSAELQQFTSSLRSRMKVPESVYKIIGNLHQTAHPMDVLATAMSGLGTFNGSLSAKELQLAIIAKMPNLVANSYRIQHGQTVVEPDEGLGYAANLLYMLRGTRPDEFDSWVLERQLILYAEHDLNASSFAVRVVASTQADIFAAVTAGIAALGGPLHGGANEEAMKLILGIGDPGKARAHVNELLSSGKKIMGFGHRVYKKVDPRAQLSKRLLKRLLEQRGQGDKLYELCDEIERAVWDAKKLPANLDFYAAPVFHTLGIPIEAYTPIFAAARIIGWSAHFNEELAENKIIRPDAVYIGPKGLTYVPIEKR